jgi:phytoene desaturase
VALSLLCDGRTHMVLSAIGAGLAPTDRGESMSDPRLLVTHPTWADNSAAPPGRDTYRVPAPVPDLHAAPVSWSTALAQRHARELMATLEMRGYLNPGPHLEVSHMATPRTRARAGLAAGAPSSHVRTFHRARPWGPGNLHPILSNVVFAGTGTHPGVGIPMVLISGKPAAGRVVS